MQEICLKAGAASGMKEIQIFRKEIQAGRNKFQIRRNEIQIKIPTFLRRIEPFQRLTLTPTAFFLFEADSGCKCRGKAGVACSPRKLFVGPSVFVFGSSGCLNKGVKGWRRFMIADAWRRLSDLSAAEPMSAKREPSAPRRPKAPGTAEKTGRSIRCPARIRPLHEARTGFEPLESGRAPALHAWSISRPLPFNLIPSFRPCEADAAAFRRAP